MLLQISTVDKVNGKLKYHKTSDNWNACAGSSKEFLLVFEHEHSDA